MLEWITRPTLPELTAEFCRRLHALDAAQPTTAVALTGGRSAGAFYDAWAAHAGTGGIEPRWQFFWSDERAVPPSDADSNVKLAMERLLRPGQVDAGRIHAPATALPPAECAAAYAAEIRKSVPAGADGTPRFPLIILGMGADGHTGSLFPGRDPFTSQQLLVRAVEETGAHPHARITFTPQLINAAGEVWFLITGAAKAWAVEQLAERTAAVDTIPALAVDPAQTRITIFADESSTGGRQFAAVKS